jgi:hypothetical protein
MQSKMRIADPDGVVVFLFRIPTVCTASAASPSGRRVTRPGAARGFMAW